MTTTTRPVEADATRSGRRAATPARPTAGIPAALAWVLRTEQRVLDVLARIGIPVLRLALAFVYVAFGALKIAGLSPVSDLVASMLPFLPATQAVVAMGVFEVVVGLLLAVGVLVPWIAAAQVLHLLGTFAVFLVHPALTFEGGNPLALTVVGEFIAKNVVLIAGLLVVAAFSRTRPAHR